MRMVMRCVRAIPQTVLTFRRIAGQQLVSRLAAYPELAAQLSYRRIALFDQSNKPRAFNHGTGLFPWHRQAPPADIVTCYQSSRSSLLPFIPVRTPPLPPRSGVTADNNSLRYIPKLLRVRRIGFSTTMKRLLVSLFEGKLHHVSKVSKAEDVAYRSEIRLTVD
jgi:hypothetical protein